MQQTLSTQKVLLHSLPDAHCVPAALSGKQTPVESQY
jgi:hypothetical protein